MNPENSKRRIRNTRQKTGIIIILSYVAKQRAFTLIENLSEE